MNHINKKNSCVSDINKKMEEMNNYITKLKEEIVKLKEENEKLNKQVIIQNNTTQNTYNITNIIQINNFNDTKDYNGNFKNLLKEIGKSIYVKTIKNVYLNPEKPENHNIYVADKNRGLVKVYNNGLWESKSIIIIDDIIDNVVKYFNLSIEELKKDHEKYERLKNTISNKINYIQFLHQNYTKLHRSMRIVVIIV